MCSSDLVSIILLCVLYGAIIVGAVISGQIVYQAWRRLTSRPLTDEERWQETSVESLNEENWASLLSWCDTMDDELNDVDSSLSQG